MDVKAAVRRIVPDPILWRAQIARDRRRDNAELAVASGLLGPGSIFVDVGANTGIYSKMALVAGATVIAIEPVPWLAVALRDLVGERGDVIEAAISLHPGPTATLFVPQADSGDEVLSRSSLDRTANGDLRLREVTVGVAKLDDVVSTCDVLKVDVEGLELEVLKTASAMIAGSRPILIVEVEARHRGQAEAVEVFDLVTGWGYHGWFIDRSVDRRRLNPLESFDFAVHQAPANVKPIGADGPTTYVCNFIFMPAEREVTITAQLRSAGLKFA